MYAPLRIAFLRVARFATLALYGLFGMHSAAVAAPIGSYTLSVVGGGQDSTMIKVTAKAKSGKTFEEEFTIGGLTEPGTGRDLILSSLTSSGWTATSSGAAGIIINGHGDSPITEVDSGIKKIDTSGMGHFYLALDGSSGVKLGETTVGTDYKFSFIPLDAGSTVLASDGLVLATIDDMLFQASVHAGQGPTEVASELFDALLAGGIAARLSSNEVSFINNSAGIEALKVELALTASGLESMITIADRLVVAEPSSLVLVMSGSLLLLVVTCPGSLLRHRLGLLSRTSS